MPILVLIGDVIGIFGGYVVGVYKLGFNPANYVNSTLQNLQAIDITTGLVKAAVFGFIISLMGCYNGYKSKGGAQGVGTGNHKCGCVCIYSDFDIQLCHYRTFLFKIKLWRNKNE